VHAMQGVCCKPALPLTARRLAYREAIGAGGDSLGGELYPRRRTGDFKHKLSPNRFFEFGAVTNGDHESPPTPDNTTLIVPFRVGFPNESMVSLAARFDGEIARPFIVAPREITPSRIGAMGAPQLLGPSPETSMT
jgi:hypothetical protein